MDGCGSLVYIYFFLVFYEQEIKFEWIIFYEVLVIIKVYVRIVCLICYEWVRDLLFKLYEFNVYDLSSVV